MKHRSVVGTLHKGVPFFSVLGAIAMGRDRHKGSWKERQNYTQSTWQRMFDIIRAHAIFAPFTVSFQFTAWGLI